MLKSIPAFSQAAIIGALFLLPLHNTAHAAANSPQVRACVHDIVKQERSAARNTKGDERRALIAALGKVKIDCMNGDIEIAYRTAAKLKLGPQQAAAAN
jgi:hypothetical protein